MTAARRSSAPPPASQLLTLQQGLTLLGQGRLIEAEFAFTSVLASSPSLFEALQFLAALRIQQGRFLEALDLLNRALRQRRRSPEALGLHGVALSRLDRHDEALADFDKVLAQRPQDVETLYNRGVSLAKLGRQSEALASYRQALDVRPTHAPSLLNLANNLAKLGQYDEALALYDRLIAVAPANIEAFNNRGNVFFSLERYNDALADYDRGLALSPNQLDLLGNRGKALKALGNHRGALECYDRIVAIRPQDADAITERGASLVALDRAQEAIECLAGALSLVPDHRGALNQLCAALHRLGRYEESLETANRALAIDPNDALGYFSRGNALQALNRYEPAVECYLTSLALAPGVANVHKNLGGALHVLERHDEAIFHYEQALALGGKDDETQASKSLVYLSLGRLAEGFEHYDSRFSADKSMPRRNYPQSRWQGEFVPGTLLIWGEQGLGDQILYGSMIPDAARRAASVVVEVEPRLVDLFARSFPDVRVTAIGKDLYAGEIQAQSPIGSLGRYLRSADDMFPRGNGGFLVADAARTRALRQRLAGDGRRVVGLSWRSQNPKFEQAKSADLADFEAVLRLPNCRFVDLQYGDTLIDRERTERAIGVRVEHLDDIDNTRDIDALAALISACDVVVTVSNTTAHLAGGLGRPTFVMVPYGHARLWYWFKDRDDSPWYPKLRVKRMQSGQPWAALVAAHADEIADAVQGISVGIRAGG